MLSSKVRCSRQRLAATNQFQADEADKILNTCRNNRAAVEWAAKFKP